MTGAASIFALTLRHSIWRVTFDGVFFGDYRSERQALEGIAEAQRKLATTAKVIRVDEARH
jgi:hypothetical protein